MHQSFVGTAVLVQQVVELGRSLWGSDSGWSASKSNSWKTAACSLWSRNWVQSSVQQSLFLSTKWSRHGVASNENADGQNVSGHSVPRPWVLLAPSWTWTLLVTTKKRAKINPAVDGIMVLARKWFITKVFVRVWLGRGHPYTRTMARRHILLVFCWKRVIFYGGKVLLIQWVCAFNAGFFFFFV